MESVFITKIFALTEEILRGDSRFEPMREALQVHLAKAQKLGMRRYEAEVFNTLGILYLFAGNSDESIRYFTQGLETARRTDDSDLKIKLFSNLSETYMGIWDLDNTNRYLDEGIALAKADHLTTLPILYLYGNKINALVLAGAYAGANALLEEIWPLAENPDLVRYSKYEYLQVVFSLRNLKAIIEIALGHCEAATKPLENAVQLAGETTNNDFITLTHLSQVYYNLICKRDEASALQWEQAAVEAGGGQLSFNSALNLAFFMLYNHQPEWAQKYAGVVLEQASGGKSIPAQATAHAERIREAVRQIRAR